MRRTILFSMAVLLVASVASLDAAEPAKKGTTAKKGEKPQDSPGWIIIEEDFWFPWRFEFGDWLHQARVHHRQNEEEAAANEIRKAESWLRFAASHALPITKKSLETAADDLHDLHLDIREGQLVTANRMDYTLARADHALAEWHFFKAKENLGKEEERLAAQNLEAAGRYLQDAARSARYEYGAESVTLFEDIDKDGKLVDDGISIDRNRLNDNLTALQRQVTRMGAVLKKAAEK